MGKKALLLVNVGTPDKPEVPEVRKYLRNFLNDKWVIDLPWLARKILVNLVIIPFRVRRSTSLYRKLWTGDGSPLLVFMNSLVEKLHKQKGHDLFVVGAMRYGNPSIKESIKKIKEKGIKSVLVFPLYPHYSLSTTQSLIEYIIPLARTEGINVKIIRQFYENSSYINALVNRIESYNPGSYDHILFSYHGLPVRQIIKIHPEIKTDDCSCKKEMPAHGKFCYRAGCYNTTRLLAARLGLEEERYTTSFQSRLSKGWLQPFSDEIISDLVRTGVKKLLVVAPSFVADCLETTIEIGDELRGLFITGGGERLELVEALNDADEWGNAIIDITRDKSCY